MTLGEFREKTRKLGDETVLILFTGESREGKSVVRDGIEVPVNALDFDKGVNGEFILTLTDGNEGSYSL